MARKAAEASLAPRARQALASSRSGNGPLGAGRVQIRIVVLAPAVASLRVNEKIIPVPAQRADRFARRQGRGGFRRLRGGQPQPRIAINRIGWINGKILQFVVNENSGVICAGINVHGLVTMKRCEFQPQCSIDNQCCQPERITNLW